MALWRLKIRTASLNSARSNLFHMWKQNPSRNPGHSCAWTWQNTGKGKMAFMCQYHIFGRALSVITADMKRYASAWQEASLATRRGWADPENRRWKSLKRKNKKPVWHEHRARREPQRNSFPPKPPKNRNIYIYSVKIITIACCDNGV